MRAARLIGDAGRLQGAVVNISLVGPDNMLLRQLVRQMIARGHIIVAAVGNDGPAAPKDAMGCGHTGAKRTKTTHFRTAVALTAILSLTASGNSGNSGLGRPRARLVTQAPPLP
jgi:hypothetical protein